ncbi:unnamed protein product, partial [Iphiclides podalirius]
MSPIMEWGARFKMLLALMRYDVGYCAPVERRNKCCIDHGDAHPPPHRPSPAAARPPSITRPARSGEPKV